MAGPGLADDLKLNRFEFNTVLASGSGNGVGVQDHCFCHLPQLSLEKYPRSTKLIVDNYERPRILSFS